MPAHRRRAGVRHEFSCGTSGSALNSLKIKDKSNVPSDPQRQPGTCRRQPAAGRQPGPGLPPGGLRSVRPHPGRLRRQAQGAQHLPERGHSHLRHLGAQVQPGGGQPGQHRGAVRLRRPAVRPEALLRQRRSGQRGQPVHAAWPRIPRGLRRGHRRRPAGRPGRPCRGGARRARQGPAPRTGRRDRRRAGLRGGAGRALIRPLPMGCLAAHRVELPGIRDRRLSPAPCSRRSIS
ncbi:hypothetical protein OF001_U30266 [Pseudomonas sp. OF001]|nr:hypothetical protein OF001_U30266 [Pseudomonas sp. OF001]